MPKILENVRENIIIEGRNLLLSKTYKELSIREIAKKCKIAVGTFYNYFPNKEELAVEIFRDDWKKIAILVEDLKQTEEPFKEKINKIYIAVEGFLSSYLSIFHEMSVHNNCGCREEHTIEIFFVKVSELIDIERSKGNINSALSSYKLSKFIVSNLMQLCREKYMSFDELYDSLKL